MRYARSLARTALVVIALSAGACATLSAQASAKALVYCPVGIDTSGCDNIVAALSAPGTGFSAVDRGWDGTGGTVDLAAADLAAYAVVVVPSLADGADGRPYDRLRGATVAGRLKAAITGRQAIWSGTPDLGTAGATDKTTLLQSLAAWAASGSGTGLVALLDGSDSTAQRYDWVTGISALVVVADSVPGTYAAVRALTPTGAAITAPGGQALAYANMAAFGLHAGSGTTEDAADSATSMPILVSTAGASAAAPAPTGLRALVYCPAADAGGCDNIVAALTAAGTPFAGGADRGYDGASGTLDLRTADLSAYGVFVVPSLADGADGQPYAVLRDPAVATRLKAALLGPVAVWSGTPDLGDSSRAQKNILISNLAKWAAAAAQTTAGARGLVALQDASDSVPARYSWLGLISRASIGADTTLDVYSNVQALTPTAVTLLDNGSGLQLGYTNMASFGLVPGAGLGADAAGGRTSAIVLATSASSGGAGAGFATVTTDRDDYQPGDTITVTGAGWSPGETVSLLFHEDVSPPIHPDKVLTTVADASGRIVNHQYEIESTDLGVRFTLTATGQASGRTAQATFTDASRTIQAATVVAPITATITALSYTGNSTCTGANTSLGSFNLTSSLSTITTGNVNGQSVKLTANATATNPASSPLLSWTGSGTFTVVSGEPLAICVSGTNGNQTDTYKPVYQTTSTSVASSVSPSAFGQSVTFTATITSLIGGTVNAGTVTFNDGATALGSGSVNGSGQATLSTGALAVGSHTITAVYNGSGNFTASTSSSITQSITAASTVTALSSSVNSSVFGQPVTLSAAVSPVAPGGGVPTGTVQFKIDGSNFGAPVALSSGTASSGSTSSLSVGPHSVAAVYTPANSNYTGSTSTVIATQTVNAANTTTTVASPSNPSAFGQSFTFTATVAVQAPGAGTPTGTVQFRVDGADFGSPVTLSGGSATSPTVSGLSIGSHTLAAVYSGDSNFGTSTSTSFNHTVGKANQTIAFDLSTLPVKTFGDPDFSVASFASASSGLTVSFSSGSPTRCSVSSAGLVHIITAAGNCMIVASQSGDAHYNAAPNVSQTINIAKASQTITFTSTAPVGAIVGGPPYTGTATATSGLTVTFSSLTPLVCTSSGTNGATFTFVGGGTCTVAANQTGNGDYNAAPQVTQSFSVSAQAPQTITFTSTAPSNAVFGGPTYAVNATATSGLTVVFSSLTTGVCTVAGSTVSFVGVGTCTVAANQPGNASFLPAPQVTQSFAVGQASQTITFAALADKTYGDADFGVSATASSGLAVTFAAGGQCTVTVATVHLTGAGSCTITASQAGNANYTAATDVPRSFTINKASVAPHITAQDKTYDGTTGATIVTRTLTGKVGTDDVSLDGGTASFADKHAGVGKTVTGSGFSLVGADAGNYQLSPLTATTTATIFQRAIEVSAVTNTKTYDGTTSSTATPSVTSGTIVGGDTPAFIQTFDTKDVGTNKMLIASGSVTDGNGGNDYTVAFHTNGTGVIQAKALVGSITASDRTYDGNTTATIATRSVSGKIGSEDVSYVGGSATFDNRNAGSGKTVTATGLSLAGADAGNYTVNTTATTTATIHQLAIGVTAVSDTKIYDGNTSSAGTPAISSGALANGDTPNFTQAFDTKNVGNAKTLTPAGSVSDGNGGNNYDVSFHSVTTGKITQRPLGVSATGVNKVYDGTTSATVNLSDDRVPGDMLTLNYASASFADRNAGTGKPVSVSGITVTGTDAGNYTFSTTTSTTANIDQRPITVTAAADSKTYDGTTASSATPTITLGNLVPGDTPNFTQAFDSKHVGNSKALTAAGSVNDGNGGNNYAVTFHTNTGVISARPITVTATAETKTYDGTTSSSATPTISTGTLAVGDSPNFSQTFDNKHAGTNKTLTPAGSVNDANSGNNYAVTFQPVTTGEIKPKLVTPVIVANDKPYDQTTTATLSSQTVTGTIDPDVVTLIVGAANFDTKQAGTNKTVTATGLSLGGANASDYMLNALTATDLADINPILLTVAAHGVNKVYDHGTAATVTLSATPISGDVVTLSYSSASFVDKNVGTGKPVSVSGITTGGADGGNYTPNTTATTSADITPAPLTVTAQGINKVYDAATAATVTLVVPVYLGDAATGSYTSASFSDKNVGTGKPVSVSGIAISGADAFNYQLQNTTATTTANITKRDLTVTALAANKYWDGTTTAAVTLSATPLAGDVVAPIGYSSANFSNANVGLGKTVTVLGVNFAGGDGGNYSPVPVPVTTTASILAWTLAGFYQPVDMPAGGMVWNTVKGGSTVPLKFEVFVGSVERTDVGAVKSFSATTAACSGAGTEDPIEVTTTGGTVLRYDGTAGQFIQNWQTPKTPGACITTTMTTQDGSTLTAYFKLK